MTEGVPEEIVTEVTVPLTAALPSEGVAVTVSPNIEVAWMAERFCDMFCDCCKALNCASCAANSVSLCGSNGSCEDICVTRSCRKSA